MMNHSRSLACALLLVVGSPAGSADCGSPYCGGTSAKAFSGKVVAVLDGDTLLVLRGGKPVKVRLAEVDAPEKAQPNGTASQKSLADLVMGRQIEVAIRATDDYGRLVATVHAGELNVNHEQVRRGMAWEYSRSASWAASRRSLRDTLHGNRELMALQRDAQQARRGVWAEDGAIEPAQWRKQHAAAQANPAAPGFISEPAGQPACTGKRYCSQMASCEEAKRYLERCGPKSLDGDLDGIPCEKLCSPQESKTD